MKIKWEELTPEQTSRLKNIIDQSKQPEITEFKPADVTSEPETPQGVERQIELGRIKSGKLTPTDYARAYAESIARGVDPIGKYGPIPTALNTILTAVRSGEINPLDPEFQETFKAMREESEALQEQVPGTVVTELATGLSPIGGPARVTKAVTKAVRGIKGLETLYKTPYKELQESAKTALPFLGEKAKHLPEIAKTAIGVGEAVGQTAAVSGANAILGMATGVNPKDLNVGEDIKLSAGISGALGGAKIAAYPFAKGLKNIAEVRAIKSIGAMAPEFKKIIKGWESGRQPSLKELGDFLGRRNLVKKTILESSDAIDELIPKLENELVSHLTEVQNKFFASNKGKTYSEAFKNMKSTIFDLKKVGKEIETKINQTMLPPDDKIRRIEEVRRWVDNQDVSPYMTPTKLLEYKRELRKQIPEGIYIVGTDSQKNIAKLDLDHYMTRGLEDMANKMADKIDDPALKNKVREINREYQKAIITSNIAKVGLGRSLGRRTVGLSETLFGVPVAVSTGNIPLGIAAGVAANIGRNYGDWIIHKTADKISKVIDTDPKKLGKFKTTLIQNAKLGRVSLIQKINELSKNAEFNEMVNNLKDLQPIDQNLANEYAKIIEKHPGISNVDKAKARSTLKHLNALDRNIYQQIEGKQQDGY